MKRAIGNPGWLPKEVKREGVSKGIETFTQNVAGLTADLHAAPKMVAALCEIDKHEQPNAYKFCVDFLLDNLKYDIQNAHKKTGLRRMIERKVRKSKVQEIPNMVDLFDI